ncbi:unnamed protein product [Trichobilharzia regenti]|nr:unnamed protein product [Trichobilharzia regenti]
MLGKHIFALTGKRSLRTKLLNVVLNLTSYQICCGDAGEGSGSDRIKASIERTTRDLYNRAKEKTGHLNSLIQDTLSQMKSMREEKLQQRNLKSIQKRKITREKPNERSFDETVHTLHHQFGDQRYLFNIRYHCMKLVLNENDDIHTHLGIVNLTCERFQFKSLSKGQFKALIFICGLQSPKFADIRIRLLNRLEQDLRMTLKDIGEECQRLINIHNDTALVHTPAPRKYIDMAINTRPARLQIDKASDITIISKKL